MKAAGFDEALADKLLDLIGEGSSLRSACERAGIPRRTVRSWIERRSSFAQAFEAACAVRIEVLADSIADLAERAQEIAAAAEDKKANAAVNALRVEIDAKKWLLAQLAPDRFGERVTLNNSDPLEGLSVAERFALDAALGALATDAGGASKAKPRKARRGDDTGAGKEAGQPADDGAGGALVSPGRLPGERELDPFRPGTPRPRQPASAAEALLGVTPSSKVH